MRYAWTSLIPPVEAQQIKDTSAPVRYQSSHTGGGASETKEVQLIKHLISMCDNCKRPESGQTEEPTAADHLCPSEEIIS